MRRKNNNYHKPTVLLSFFFCFSPLSKSCATIFFAYYCSDSRVTHTRLKHCLSIYQLLSRYQPSSVLRRSGTEENKNKSFFRHIFFSPPTHPINQSIHHGDHNNNSSQRGLAKPPSRKRPLHHQYRLISLRRHLFLGCRRRSTIAKTPRRKTQFGTLRNYYP